MKKVYEKPLAMAVKLELPQMVCASLTEQQKRTFKVEDGFEWGATTKTSPYANDAWVDQGHTGTEVGGWPAVSTEDVDVDTRAKGFAW